MDIFKILCNRKIYITLVTSYITLKTIRTYVYMYVYVYIQSTHVIAYKVATQDKIILSFSKVFNNIKSLIIIFHIFNTIRFSYYLNIIFRIKRI